MGVDSIPPTRLAGVYAQPLRNCISASSLTQPRPTATRFYITWKLPQPTKQEQPLKANAAQSDFTITGTEVIVRKLNTYLTISKEMMEDADFVDNDINTRIVGRLLQTEDNQVLYGNNVSPNLMGLKGQASYDVNYYSGTTAIQISTILIFCPVR